MRSVLLKFLLPVLMLLTQHMAMAHEVGHLGEQLAGQAAHRQLPGKVSCEQCVAFADLAAAVHCAATPPPVDLRSFDHCVFVPASVLAAASLAPRSRGPPVPF
jgi:hypothetical protein